MGATPHENFAREKLEESVTRFPTDSRDVGTGEVFFAFAQPEFENNGFNGDFQDAAKYVRGAIESGAVACVVRSDKIAEHGLEDVSSNLIVAEDSIRAFQNLANGVCREWGGPVVAVTGSAGKTTAKELTAHVLACGGKKVLSNLKNLNNGLGHPMTVLRLAADGDFDVAVLEMGMSTPKREIARLCEITPPDVSVVLNVLPVHVEHLGSIENVAKAKAEIVEGLKPDGVAVLNADDPRVAAMAETAKGKSVTFGIERDADFTATEIEMKRFGETHFILNTPDGSERVVFQLSGKHNILNSLAAAAVGWQFGMTAAEIVAALGTVKPPSQRGEVMRFEGGFTVINDSYNSNPEALLKMVETINSDASRTGRRIIIAGEMLELGPEEKSIHRETGKEIAVRGADIVVGVRGLARDLVEGAGADGALETRFFDTPEEAGDYVSGILNEGDLVLIKGSRGVRTEKAAEVIASRHRVVG